MAIQSVSFTEHKRKSSPLKDALNIGLKGGIGAALGFVVGRYVVPVSSEVAEKIALEDMEDHFIAQKTQHKRKSQIKNEEVTKPIKVTTPKARLNVYIKVKKLTLQQTEKLKTAFEKYTTDFFKKNGGKEAYIEKVRNELRSGVGKKLAILTGGIFAFAAIVDEAVKSNHRSR